MKDGRRTEVEKRRSGVRMTRKRTSLHTCYQYLDAHDVIIIVLCPLFLVCAYTSSPLVCSNQNKPRAADNCLGSLVERQMTQVLFIYQVMVT